MRQAIAIAFAILFIFCVVASVYASAETYVGTIEIPSINCKFDLSYSGRQLNSHQHIALLFKQDGAICVGNHYGSASPTGGQWKLENLRVGDKAYIEYVTMDGLEEVHHTGNYVCYAIFLADVVDGRFFCQGKEVLPYADTDLICRTCVGHDSTRNYVGLFEKVS